MDNWEWQGHAGHFIASARCLFRLATVVGNGRWLVSTVGDYSPDDRHPPTKVGLDRLFETMVFRCTDKRHDCGCRVVEEWTERDMRGYMTPQEATSGHLALCEEWDNRDDA